jgi:pre-mRNA cleavage complex 2 protein Pcf11
VHEWSKDAQDWIWRDAERVGNRVYHASCRAEAMRTKKDGEKKDAAEAAFGGGKSGLVKKRGPSIDGTAERDGRPKTRLKTDIKLEYDE